VVDVVDEGRLRAEIGVYIIFDSDKKGHHNSLLII
jgi:hypothetical protein